MGHWLRWLQVHYSLFLLYHPLSSKAVKTFRCNNSGDEGCKSHQSNRTLVLFRRYEVEAAPWFDSVPAKSKESVAAVYGSIDARDRFFLDSHNENHEDATWPGIPGRPDSQTEWAPQGKDGDVVHKISAVGTFKVKLHLWISQPGNSHISLFLWRDFYTSLSTSIFAWDSQTHSCPLTPAH